MITEESKLYVQLALDETSKQNIVTLQNSLILNDKSRLVKPHSLHITVLHIGSVSRLFESLDKEIKYDYETVLKHIDKLTKDLKAAIALYTKTQFTFVPTTFELLGVYSNTLVIRYTSTPEIKKLHQICLNILIQFFKICGIDNVETFMNSDPNFKNELTIKPHLTVAKAYSGELPSIDVENINASLMKILQ